MTEAKQIIIKDRAGNSLLPITNAALVQVDVDSTSVKLDTYLKNSYSESLQIGDTYLSTEDTIQGAFAEAELEFTISK